MARPVRKRIPPNRVKYYRMKLMLSRRELANKAGISVEALCKIENRTTIPRLPTMRKILIALGKDVSEAETVFPGYAE
ncbi:MAG: helix-turn-helix transcriptional regulator [candidate division WOR-3 bacterium]